MSYESFSLPIAIELYLGRKAIDWGVEVTIDPTLQIILSWNIVTHPQPTIEQLTILFEDEKLNYYKNLQRDKIRRQLAYTLTEGLSQGVATSLVDSASVSIVMDAKERDVLNYMCAVTYAEAYGLASMTLPDHNGVYRAFDLNQLKTIRNEVIGAGLQVYSNCWQKLSDIAAATSIATVVAIDWNS